MLSKTIAVFVCLLMVFSSSCTFRKQNLDIVTPEATPESPTATATLTADMPSPSETPPPTPIPRAAIGPENLKQVKLLHEYWLTLATAVGIDPYEMDISAVASSPDGGLLAVGGCSKPLEEDLRSGNLACDGEDAQKTGGVPFLVILDADAESVIETIPENEANRRIK